MEPLSRPVLGREGSGCCDLEVGECREFVVPQTHVLPCVNNFMRLDLVDEEARCVARGRSDVGEGLQLSS